MGAALRSKKTSIARRILTLCCLACDTQAVIDGGNYIAQVQQGFTPCKTDKSAHGRRCACIICFAMQIKSLHIYSGLSHSRESNSGGACGSSCVEDVRIHSPTTRIFLLSSYRRNTAEAHSSNYAPWIETVSAAPEFGMPLSFRLLDFTLLPDPATTEAIPGRLGQADRTGARPWPDRWADQFLRTGRN
jgi:hypothetical protein